ncbi:MAG: photoactive yellow protein [Bdellovibrio sp.]|nr:photoactive yellow protein [Bdellovibrio sp.]
MSFVTEEIITKLGTLTREEADRAEYGLVKVDPTGKILLYNHYESKLAGVAPSAAEGRNFFKDIAPCTNNRLFMGRFLQGVEKGEIDTSFNYTFTYKMKPTNVLIRLLHDKASKTNWIFVKAAA